VISSPMRCCVYLLCLVGTVCSGCHPSASKPHRASPDTSPKSAEVSQASQPTAAINPEARRLFLVKQNGKFGYIDGGGNIVISPQFDACEDFSEGLAAIAFKRGEEVIEGTDMRFAILRWGFINEAGDIVVPVKFSRVGKFSNGLAWVEKGDNELRSNYGMDKHGYIDKTGKVVIAFRLAFIFDPHGVDDGRGDFTEGQTVVKVGRKQGYIDLTGRLVIQPQFDDADSFSEGVAAVKIGGKYGYIDRNGKVAISPRFSWASRFSEGLAAVGTEEGDGYIDKSGKVIIIGGRSSMGSSFSEGLTPVRTDEGTKYIDKSGNTVVTTRGNTGGFQEGMATGRFGESYGYIDKTGNEVISPEFTMVEAFSGGLAKVHTSLNRFGYVDKAGQYVWPPSD
jgi:WG repeat protein